MNSPTIAPGARVLIRDTEWIVKRVDRTATGGQSVQVVGVSEIVRHKEARFLTELEGAPFLIPLRRSSFPTLLLSFATPNCIWKACCASRRPLGMISGSVTARRSMTYPTNWSRPCLLWSSPGSASSLPTLSVAPP